MSWFKKILANTKPTKQITNLNSGKSFDEQYNELGVFTYDDEGFTILYEACTKNLKWNDITQLNVYKVDLFTYDCIEMEIVYGDKCFTISEDLPGWYQFVLKTKEVFPSIPQDWDLTIIHPAFATNYRTIYEKEKKNAV